MPEIFSILYIYNYWSNQKSERVWLIISVHEISIVANKGKDKFLLQHQVQTRVDDNFNIGTYGWTRIAYEKWLKEKMKVKQKKKMAIGY